MLFLKKIVYLLKEIIFDFAIFVIYKLLIQQVSFNYINEISENHIFNVNYSILRKNQH